MNNKLNWINQAQLISSAELLNFGQTLVIAPHQDDESLGCGGTIALLRQANIPVQVVFMTDGSMSHPNSLLYPAEKLILTREIEAVEALKVLGVESSEIRFLRLKDGSLPSRGRTDFEEAVNRLTAVLYKVGPQTILIPWQRDPHPDHRATWQIIQAALAPIDQQPTQLEYFIWLWERADPADLPLLGEVEVFKVNIEPVIGLKKQAIEAHISQTTTLIDDDPDGFILSPEVLAHFEKADEIFIKKLI
ncbi:hypothetical protein ADIARSV_3166 [Arcticibacter svalbardensis MN12-7]|uniref:LmbE family protein n=1 Tax=Arcticibacter svalbardensis MN12-7 TaxID=1150600 RepID=R9GPB6_9SPHI|nr:PIG-L deacetylase family protein [Arcticibacter svalbardensis]EOR93657.1 hypothetical protein ADIARSV_3166 [Arcticibacter svalbardensis MN12-7]